MPAPELANPARGLLSTATFLGSKASSRVGTTDGWAGSGFAARAARAHFFVRIPLRSSSGHACSRSPEPQSSRFVIRLDFSPSNQRSLASSPTSRSHNSKSTLRVLVFSFSSACALAADSSIQMQTGPLDRLIETPR
jgi:hypothetical protein